MWLPATPVGILREVNALYEVVDSAPDLRGGHAPQPRIHVQDLPASQRAWQRIELQEACLSTPLGCNQCAVQKTQPSAPL